jgi:ATP-dependent helicase HrpB
MMGGAVRAYTPAPNPSPQGGGGHFCATASTRFSRSLAAAPAKAFPSPLWGGARGGGNFERFHPRNSKDQSTS